MRIVPLVTDLISASFDRVDALGPGIGIASLHPGRHLISNPGKKAPGGDATIASVWFCDWMPAGGHRRVLATVKFSDWHPRNGESRQRRVRLIAEYETAATEASRVDVAEGDPGSEDPFFDYWRALPWDQSPRHLSIDGDIFVAGVRNLGLQGAIHFAYPKQAALQNLEAYIKSICEQAGFGSSAE